MRACLAIVTGLLIGACGFLPEDDFTGVRAGDGVAPWTDLGPAPACLGNQFLGPPTSTPGGFCFDRNRVEAPCLDDGDCGSREACTCGRCTVPYCTAASDCAGGRTCTFSENRCDVVCADTTDCAPGEECFNGTCRGRCDRDDECQTGEVCNSRNYCVTVDCADDAGCMSDERCHVQRVPRLVTEPFAVASETSPRVVLYVEVGEEALPLRAIWRAVSEDGVHFVLSPARPVVEDGGAAHAPSLIRTAAGWVMYYEAGDGESIKVAVSPDGIAFGTAKVVLAGGPGPAAVRAPSAVLLPDDTVAVYYQQGDGDGIALATGELGEMLTSRGTVLTPARIAVAPGAPTEPFWADVVAVRSPHAAVTIGPDGPSLRLWYSAFGRESAVSKQFGMDVPIPPNFSVGYAVARVDAPAELTPWPYGPVIDRVDAFLSHKEELAPGVVQLVDGDGANAAYLMYYVEATANDNAMGVAGPFTTGRLGVLGNGAYSALTAP
ncbi:MAG TPA: hypothetical protein VM734_00105 [Kofleriaceae bacterium]|nr:hypothetical protein [Kofleriaceae bacterium]